MDRFNHTSMDNINSWSTVEHAIAQSCKCECTHKIQYLYAPAKIHKTKVAFIGCLEAKPPKLVSQTIPKDAFYILFSINLYGGQYKYQV